MKRLHLSSQLSKHLEEFVRVPDIKLGPVTLIYSVVEYPSSKWKCPLPGNTLELSKVTMPEIL